MENIDITTVAGISAISGAFVQAFKQIYSKYIRENVSKFITILSAFVICEGISFLAYYVDFQTGDTIRNTLIRGAEAGVLTIGGYESIKQLLGLFSK